MEAGVLQRTLDMVASQVETWIGPIYEVDVSLVGEKDEATRDYIVAASMRFAGKERRNTFLFESFPMTKAPGRYLTDFYARVARWVDESVKEILAGQEESNESP